MCGEGGFVALVVLTSEALSTHGMPLKQTSMRIMWSPFGLCSRPGMGPVKLFIIKLVSELGVCVLAYSP